MCAQTPLVCHHASHFAGGASLRRSREPLPSPLRDPLRPAAPLKSTLSSHCPCNRDGCGSDGVDGQSTNNDHRRRSHQLISSLMSWECSLPASSVSVRATVSVRVLVCIYGWPWCNGSDIAARFSACETDALSELTRIGQPVLKHPRASRSIRQVCLSANNADSVFLVLKNMFICFSCLERKLIVCFVACRVC